LSPKKKKTLPSILSKLKLSINVYNFKIDFWFKSSCFGHWPCYPTYQNTINFVTNYKP
jgi:hypothetical protein